MKAISYGELVSENSNVGIRAVPVVWVNNARILAAFAVVVLHVCANLDMNSAGINSFFWWTIHFYDSLTIWCVPVFVMLSGLLLLDPRKDEPAIIFYRKRASKILIPLVFWTIFFSGWKYFLSATNGENLSIGSLFKMGIMGFTYYHLWYLFMIIGLYIFTPFIRKIIRRSSDKELLFLCIVLFAFSIVSTALNSYYSHSDLSPIFSFVYYLPYFLAGLLIYKAQTNPHWLILGGIFILSVIITGMRDVLAQFSGLATLSQFLFKYLSIAVVLMSISVMFFLKRFSAPIINSNISNRIALLSFGIYLIHPVFIDIILELLGIQVKSSNALFSIPLIAISAFVLSLSAAMIITKIPVVKRII